MKDLLTDEPFSRSDLLTLQDPAHPEKWDISTFFHLKNKSDGNAILRRTCVVYRDIHGGW